MVNFINLSAHNIVILNADTPVEHLELKGRPALVFSGEKLSEWIDLIIPSSGLPLPKVETGSTETRELQVDVESTEAKISISVEGIGKKVITNLPEPKENTYYISSALCSSVAKELGRTDVLAPKQLVLKLNEDGSTLILGTLGLRG
jgi:hypothetical protein